MPLVDMPLQELLKYEGCTPVPDDFDEFWKRSLEEMKNTPREVRLEKAEFQAPGVNCYHLWFKGVRNAGIHAKLLIPEDAEKGKVKAPALLRFHGYSGYCGPFSEYVGLAKCGFVVAALDARGQGGLSEDTGGSYGRTYHGQIIRGLSDCPENLIFRHIFLDTAELADIIMSFDFVDETRVGAYGNSQGGALTIACSAIFLSKKQQFSTLMSAIEVVYFAVDIDYQGMRYRPGDERSLSHYLFSYLIEMIRGISRDHVGAAKIVLYSVPEAYNFYRRLGFCTFGSSMYGDRGTFVRGCEPMYFDLN